MDTAAQPAASAAVRESLVLAQAPDAKVAGEGGMEAQAQKPSLDADLRAVWDKNHPRRNRDGKFAPPDPSVAAAVGEGVTGENSAAAPAAPEGAAPDKPAGPSTKEQPAIDPPHSWSAEHRARWASVPTEVQGYIAKREKDAHQAITRAGEHVRTLQHQIHAYEPIRQLIEAHRDLFVRRGLSPAQAFAALLDAQARLDADPAAGLVQIGAHYGMDLRPLLQAKQGDPQQQPPAQAPQPHPAFAQLAADVRTLAGRVQSQEGAIEAQRQAERDALAAEFQREVDAHKDKPYFDELRPLMSALMLGGQAGTLVEAYDMAVFANRSTRERIHQDQRTQEDARRQADAQAKAEQARRAASVNVRSGSPGSQTPKTIDDTLKEIARRRYP